MSDVPRDPNEAMHRVLDDLLAATVEDDHERGVVGVICIKAWRVMHDAAEGQS